MTIYNGKYLTVSYKKEDSRFVQFWNNSPENIDTFKYEMLEYTVLYKKHQPKHSLWLQQNFTLTLDKTTQKWIEEFVNIPCKEYGNKKLAFVVSQDVLAHINVIDSFEENNSCILPKHFDSETKAINWLNEDKNIFKTTDKMSIQFEGIDEDGFGINKLPRRRAYEVLS